MAMYTLREMLRTPKNCGQPYDDSPCVLAHMNFNLGYVQSAILHHKSVRLCNHQNGVSIFSLSFQETETWTDNCLQRSRTNKLSSLKPFSHKIDDVSRPYERSHDSAGIADPQVFRTKSSSPCWLCQVGLVIANVVI